MRETALAAAVISTMPLPTFRLCVRISLIASFSPVLQLGIPPLTYLVVVVRREGAEHVSGTNFTTLLLWPAIILPSLVLYV